MTNETFKKVMTMLTEIKEFLSKLPLRKTEGPDGISNREPLSISGKAF